MKPRLDLTPEEISLLRKRYPDIFVTDSRYEKKRPVALKAVGVMKLIEILAVEDLNNRPLLTREEKSLVGIGFLAGFRKAREMAEKLTLDFPNDYYDKDKNLVLSSRFSIAEFIKEMGEEEVETKS